MAAKKRRKKPVLRHAVSPESAQAAGTASLIVKAGHGSLLSPAQRRFNQLMRKLEQMRERYRQNEHSLDGLLEAYGLEIFPLVGKLGKLNFALVTECRAALDQFKLSKNRRKRLRRLIHLKSIQLLNNPDGLTEDDQATLERLVEETTDQATERAKSERLTEEFETMMDIAEAMADAAGVKLDLSGLDIHGDPDEFEAELQRRLEAAIQSDPADRAKGGRRKPNKTQLNYERRLREENEAKERDLKSLYKQLAKILHPDLEADPERRLQKEEWMKRLTTAYAENDLRELLLIEMEFMGTDTGNLEAASDQKLIVYARVLEDQIEDLRRRTNNIIHEPRYAALVPFSDPLMDDVTPVAIQKRNLLDEIREHERWLVTLQAGGPAGLAVLNDWADEIARMDRMGMGPY